ncbi:hypothetical protein [Streptomyces sp. ISID311]|uniref:hypothetical protein n=1 Tax=Streptomyces sp. ISID311 TaxID=2601673 RepID=UPI0011BD3971|nr:hypothetical protein [Streptomyces sp. ISID311]TXC95251.1 hypothetical protein FS847_23910 [Streptomyces sp. ISID311]
MAVPLPKAAVGWTAMWNFAVLRTAQGAPEIFIVIDDYGLVALPSGNPLEALAEYLPYGRDIGLRIFGARNTAGAARTSFDPVTPRLKELGATDTILSGNPNQGPLVGTTGLIPCRPGESDWSIPDSGPVSSESAGLLPSESTRESPTSGGAVYR